MLAGATAECNVSRVSRRVHFSVGRQCGRVSHDTLLGCMQSYVEHKMWPVVMDVPWYVCLLTRTLSCTEMNEPIEVSFDVRVKKSKSSNTDIAVR